MELKDWLNSINHTKENLMEDSSNKKDYPPYIINRCMSGHVDCILYANEMNMQPHLSKDMQYAFYLNSIRKKKRFSPWIKKNKVNDIDAVKQYYGYSNEKATQALKVLNNTQLNFIKQRLEKGGQNGRSNC
jgi:hypothetical protein